MAIDLGDIPTGTPPTAGEKLQIRSAIGVGTTDPVTFLALTLTNGTITSGTGVVNLTGRVVPTGVFGIDGAGGTIEIFNDLAAAQARTITARAASFGRTGIAYRADAILGWTAGNGSSTDGGNLGTADTILARDAAGILAQRNGVNAQAFRVYDTYDTAGTNYERGTFGFPIGTNTLRIGTEQAGTGVAQPIEFVTGGVARWQISAAGDLLASTTNSYDIGANAGNRPRTIYAHTNVIVGVQVRAGAQVYTAPTGLFGFSDGTSVSRGYLAAPSDGVFALQDGAQTSFGRLQLGGTADTHPAIARDGAGVKFTGAATGSTSWIKVPAVAVASLPAAATAGVGARSFVNDALTPVFGSAVANGGSAKVPVYSDGTNWNVG